MGYFTLNTKLYIDLNRQKKSEPGGTIRQTLEGGFDILFSSRTDRCAGLAVRSFRLRCAVVHHCHVSAKSGEVFLTVPAAKGITARIVCRDGRAEHGRLFGPYFCAKFAD